MLEAWRSRDLRCYRHLILDAAVLIACGVDDVGNRYILGCSVSLSEAEVHWRSFLSELKDRSLHGLELIVRDAHEGLKAARKAVFGSAPWQRCQFHLLQKFMNRYQTSVPMLVVWVEETIPEGFSVLGLPASHRRKLRTTNLVERLNEEIRRRTRVARLFPNEVACLQLMSAILMEISEDWQTAGERYVVFNDETVIEGYPKVRRSHARKGPPRAKN